MADAQITFGGSATDARRAAEQIIDKLEELSRQAVQTSAAMRLALGGIGGELAGIAKHTDISTAAHIRNRKAVDDNASAWSRWRSAVSDVNRHMRFLQNIIAVMKWPVLITGAAYAVQAINALVAGVVGLVGALGSLVGVLAVLPAAFLTLAGGIGATVLAFGGLKKALDGNKEAWDKLTPEAKEFARTLQGIKPIVEDLRQSAQRGLFPGLTEGLNNIFSQRNVAIWRKNIQAFGKAMGDSFAEFGRWINQGEVAADFDFLMKSAADNFRIVGHAGVMFADAIRNIAVAAQPLTDWITQLIGRFGEWASQASAAGRASGNLQAFFEETKKTMQELGALFGPLGRGLLNIFKQAAPFGHELLQMLGGAAEQFRKFTDSTRGKNAIANYLNEAKEPLVEMGRLVRDLVGAILTIGSSPGLAELIRTLREELLPVITRVLTAAISGFGPALADLAVELAKFLENIVGASGPLVAFTKALTGIVKGINAIIDTVPGAGTAISAFLGMMAVGKILGIGAAISKLSVLIAGTTKVTVLGLHMTKAALISTGIGAALVAIGIAATLIIQHWDKIGPYFKALFGTLKQVFTATWTTIVEGAKAWAYVMLKWLTFPIIKFLETIGKIPGWVPIFGKIADKAGDAAQFLNAQLDKLKPNLGKVADAWGDVTFETDEATKATGNYVKALKGVTTTQAGGIIIPVAAPGASTLKAAAQTVTAPGAVKSIGGEHETAGLGWPALDVMVNPRSPVLSPCDGVVVKVSGDNTIRDSKIGLAGYNVTIAADDGNVYFLAHLGPTYVKAGSRVKRGQVLAAVFDWGGRTHIHVAVKTATTVTVPTDTTPSPTAIVPTNPPLDTKGAGTEADTVVPEASVTVIKRRVAYIEKHIGAIADPKILAQVKRQLAALRKLLRDDSITSEDLAVIENRLKRLNETYRRGIEMRQMRGWLANFRAGMKNWKQAALDSMKEMTSQEILGRVARLTALMEQQMDKGLLKLAAKTRARLNELKQLFITTFAEEIRSKRQTVADALDAVGDAALDAFDRQTQRMLKSAEDAVGAMFGVIRGETAASRRLREFREGREATAFAKTVKEANEELVAAETELARLRAEAMPDAEAVRSAEERVLQARERVNELALDAQDKALSKEAEAAEAAYQEQLEAQRRSIEESQALKREEFQNRLAIIKKGFADETLTASQAQAALMGLLREYGIDAEVQLGGTSAFSRALNELAKAIRDLTVALGGAGSAAKKAASDGGAAPTARGGGRGGIDTPTRSVWAEIASTIPTGIGQSILENLGLTVSQGAKNYMTDATRAFREVGEAKDTLWENYDEYMASTEEWSEKTTEDIVRVRVAGEEFGQSVRRVFPRVIEQLVSAQEELIEPTSLIKLYFDTMNNSVDNFGNGVGGLRAKLRDTVDEIGTLVSKLMGITGFQKPVKLATGGLAVAGRAHLIGESGPELFIPTEPGLVLSSAQTARLTNMFGRQPSQVYAVQPSGGAIVVHINRPLLLGRSLQVADEIAGAVGPAIQRRVGYRMFNR